MRRAWLAAGVLALALASPAGAQTPDTRTFDDVPVESDTIDAYAPELEISGDDVSCLSGTVDSEPEDPADHFALSECGTFGIAFLEAPKSQVSVQVRAVDFSFAESLSAVALDPANVTITAFAGETVVGSAIAEGIDEGVWAPLTVASQDGSQSIDFVRIDTDHTELAIDDLSFVPAREPETTIAGGPSGVSASRDAAFSLLSTVAGSTFECSLDAAPFEACSTALSYTGLADGRHVLLAQARDSFGNADATPAAREWTVAVTPPLPDRDGDGIPEAVDNCPRASNPGQTDEDRDGIGNECELLPSGSLPPVAGVRTTVRALSGQVLVRLPARTIVASAAQRPPGFVPLKGVRPGSEPPAQFVPLEGVASIPVESTIDTRKGQVAVTADASFDRGRETQSGRFAAAIFTIKQSRRRRPAAGGRSTTDLVLQTPPGASRACAATSTRPAKGIVRSLTGAVTGRTKGAFRAVGAASTTTVARATTWITQDRCDGTLTEVGRGRATVFDRVARTSVTVSAGQAYRARALLFGAKRRRADQ